MWNIYKKFTSYFKTKPLLLGHWNLKYKHIKYYENKNYPY